jgi:hypothetical protein
MGYLFINLQKSVYAATILAANRLKETVFSWHAAWDDRNELRTAGRVPAAIAA